MSIAILFESHEWSTFALVEKIRDLEPEIEVQLYDLEREEGIEEILSKDLLVNRIFASAYFRGHGLSLEKVKRILELAKASETVLLNSYEAHFYEIDKHYTARVMAQEGLSVPKVFGCFKSEQGEGHLQIEFPCIIKPNCGGRTTDTHVVNNQDQLTELWSQLNPEIYYLAEAYITPKAGFITRIELINGQCVQILKKTLTPDGLAAYHLGSEFYPYHDCPLEVQKLARHTMSVLSIEMGSLDIIEAAEGSYIIDVNSVSNTSEDCIAVFDFDLLAEMAKYITRKHKLIEEVSR